MPAEIPDAVDGFEGLHGAGSDERQVDPLLGLGEHLRERRPAERTALLPLRDPAPQAESMSVFRQHSHQVAVLFVAVLERIVRAQHPVGRELGRTVALEAGSDELLVRRVVTTEHAGHAIEEGTLRKTAAGRKQAEDGPLQPIR